MQFYRYYHDIEYPSLKRLNAQNSISEWDFIFKAFNVDNYLFIPIAIAWKIQFALNTPHSICIGTSDVHASEKRSSNREYYECENMEFPNILLTISCGDSMT